MIARCGLAPHPPAALLRNFMHHYCTVPSIVIMHWIINGFMRVCREHALDVASDEILSALFAKECWTDAINFFKGRPVRRFCVSDEHYIPTLLAHLGTLQALPVEILYFAAPLPNLRVIIVTIIN